MGRARSKAKEPDEEEEMVEIDRFHKSFQLHTSNTYSTPLQSLTTRKSSSSSIHYAMLRSLLSASAARRSFPAMQRKVDTTASATRAALFSTLPNRFEKNISDDIHWWSSMVVGAMIGGSATVVFCEDEGDLEEDPYDNLPEEDEPTHCSICLTYRQGPCRPYWRKVERCTKDHEIKKEEEGAKAEGDDEMGDGDDQGRDPPCLKYMLPWIDCASGYRNLYALIELDTNYTAGIADLEKEATLQACWAPSAEPTIDWNPWKEYIADHPDWKLPKRGTRPGDSKEAPVSLWKTLDSDSDPELVEIKAAVPRREGKGVLECAYALDQDGNVLGFSYGTKPSEVQKEASGNEEERAKVDAEKQEDIRVELKIRLLPLHTRRITISAAYTQPLEDDESKKEPESHIYQTRSFSLKKMGKEQ